MTIHIRTWIGGHATVTDMTNAGRRGKKCRVLRFSGVPWLHYVVADDPVRLVAVDLTRDVLYYLGGLPGSAPQFGHDATFDQVRDMVNTVVSAGRKLGVPEGLVALYDEEIRGIDAPRPLLQAGVDGAWSASADEDGVILHDLQDINEWTEISRGQTGATAYELARKVWDQIRTARTRHEASKILTESGVRLHGFCGLD
jgi:hypothetical protein